jgi:RNA polymerase sigma-70 factor (ECF subfamily)
LLPRAGGRPAVDVDGPLAAAEVRGECGADVTDAQLVMLAQRDRAAFAPLYARYAPVVLGYCRRRLGDPEAAADATSQVFVQVLNALSRCRGESFRAWLFGIAHNVTTDHLRSRAIRLGRDASFDGALDSPNDGPSLEALALAREGEESVRQLPGLQIIDIESGAVTDPGFGGMVVVPTQPPADDLYVWSIGLEMPREWCESASDLDIAEPAMQTVMRADADSLVPLVARSFPGGSQIVVVPSRR